METRFADVINQLIQEVEALRASIGQLMETISFHRRFNDFLLGRFLEESGECVEEKPDGVKSYRVGPAHFGKLKRMERRLTSSAVAESLLPSSLLITLVSRYDAFLGRLIRTMLLTRPELLKSSERTLTLANLLEFGNFDGAKEYLIEKEIESVLRKSHTDHFTWLEGKLDIPLRKDLSSWPRFVELTERRNLLVHCDGIVSHQYLTNCKENSVELDTCSVGEKLGVPPAYFRASCDCILEIAAKLTHVVWRKLCPNDREAADDALNYSCFELLMHENFALAHEILKFAHSTLKKHASERHRLMYLVNLAQASKWLNLTEDCESLLSKEDWSAKGLEFRLCVAVLQERWDDAVSIMKQIGKDGAVKAEDYRIWPVFRTARKEKQFQEGYKGIFGEEMTLGESVATVKVKDIEQFFQSLVHQKSDNDDGDTKTIDAADVSSPNSDSSKNPPV